MFFSFIKNFCYIQQNLNPLNISTVLFYYTFHPIFELLVGVFLFLTRQFP